MEQLHPFLAKLAEAGAYEPPSRPQRAANGTARTTTLPSPTDPQAARYAAAALDREAATVAATGEGTRNHTLNTAAFRVGQLVACGWLAQQAAADTLIDAGVASGLSYVEAERTVASGLDAGMRAPRIGVELHAPSTQPPAAHVVDEVALGGAQVSEGSHAMTSTEGEPATTRPRQLIDGGPFIHDELPDVPALWGAGDEVLWAAGEPTILTGPTGVGKTTLGTMLVAGRLGLLPEALGYPIAPGHRRTLVLAMDRPKQIRRAMARLLRQWPHDVLSERLVVWQGPPPADLGKHPHVLYQLAEMADADTVIIDSLKDAAIGLSGEEAGQGLSRAMNYCVTNDVEVLAYHHQTKRTNNASGKPNTIADVYGSHWITAGAGSVILLWGSAGDLVVELSHLKQPAGEVGPLHIGHDHTAGKSFLYESAGGAESILDALSAGPQTVATLASWVYGADDRAAVAKVRRRLDQLVGVGTVVQLDGPQPGARGVDGRLRGREAARYALATPKAHRGTAQGTPRNGPTLELDISAGRAVKTPLRTGDLLPEDTSSRFAEDTVNTNPQVAPKNNRSTPPYVATESTPPPPLKGVGRGPTRARTRERDPISLESHEVEVCARCHRPAERFIPAPGGRRWCPECAYPTENPMQFDDEES